MSQTLFISSILDANGLLRISTSWDQLSDENIAEMYAMRLGSYAPLYRQAFPSLAALAGGNARQAIRLLNGYYFQRTRGSNDRGTALAITAHRVAQDPPPVWF